MAARLLVVDDHTLVREGLAKLLSDHAGFEVVGEAADGFDALSKARELEPDAVLMDLYMPGLDGVRTTALIRAELPNVEVIVVTASEEEVDIFEAIQAGARGYVLKSASGASMIQQIEQVLQGDTGISGELTHKLVSEISRRGPRVDDCTEVLSAREGEVLTQVAKGATNKEIASALFISENTVRAHVRTMMQKLQRVNRTQLAVYGVREGYALEGRSSGRPNGVRV